MLIMDNILLITCQKCGYMINGRPWRCPGCGGAEDKRETAMNRGTNRGSINIITALAAWIRKKG
jgi:hypothetical protein